jgi:hypothetical protein
MRREAGAEYKSRELDRGSEGTSEEQPRVRARGRVGWATAAVAGGVARVCGCVVR